MTDLFTVYREFVARLGRFGHIVVAGGAVRDHLMARVAKDFDLFVLDTRFDEDTRAAISEALADLEVVKPLEFHNSEPYLVLTVRFEGVDVQVMCNPARTVEELVSTFDWNVCLFAFDVTGFYAREDVANIGYGKPLKLQAVRFPMSTLRRGYRFSERFNMTLDHETVLQLCVQIVSKHGAAGPNGAIPDMVALAANVLVEGG